MEFSFSPLIGVAVAAVLGGAIGLQRQAASKPAGFRTHLLVAAASAAFTAMGAHLHDTRIPSYIVVGIGFLGSGAILRQNGTTHGLTTAASIWMAAAVGLLMGYSNGFGLSVALLATVITLLALVASDNDLLRMFRIPRRALLHVTCELPHVSTEQVIQVFRAANVRFEPSDVISIESDAASGLTMQIDYLVFLKHGVDLSNLVQQIGAISTVRKVEATEATSAG